jgi:hypothetical protein
VNFFEQFFNRLKFPSGGMGGNGVAGVVRVIAGGAYLPNSICFLNSPPGRGGNGVAGVVRGFAGGISGGSAADVQPHLFGVFQGDLQKQTTTPSATPPPLRRGEFRGRAERGKKASSGKIVQRQKLLITALVNSSKFPSGGGAAHSAGVVRGFAGGAYLPNSICFLDSPPGEGRQRSCRGGKGHCTTASTNRLQKQSTTPSAFAATPPRRGIHWTRRARQKSPLGEDCSTAKAINNRTRQLFQIPLRGRGGNGVAGVVRVIAGGAYEPPAKTINHPVGYAATPP